VYVVIPLRIGIVSVAGVVVNSYVNGWTSTPIVGASQVTITLPYVAVTLDGAPGSTADEPVEKVGSIVNNVVYVPFVNSTVTPEYVVADVNPANVKPVFDIDVTEEPAILDVPVAPDKLNPPATL
jgi:hypothetical protein